MADAPWHAENERVGHTVKPAALTRRLRLEGASGRFSLASCPLMVRWAVRLLWSVGLPALAVFALAVFGGPTLPIDYELLYVVLFFIPGTICLSAGGRDRRAAAGLGGLRHRDVVLRSGLGLLVARPGGDGEPAVPVRQRRALAGLLRRRAGRPRGAHAVGPDAVSPEGLDRPAGRGAGHRHRGVRAAAAADLRPHRRGPRTRWRRTSPIR